MQKGFTLSESLMSIAIIGVISAVLIPVLSNVRPDQERVMYKKAMYTMQNAISVAINDTESSFGVAGANSAAYWADTTVDGTAFCSDIAGALGIPSTDYSCSSAGSSASPNFTTLDGIKWWGLGNHKFTTSGANKTADIYVDVNGGKGDNTVGLDQLRMRVDYEGGVTTDPAWINENDYLSDSIKFQK